MENTMLVQGMEIEMVNEAGAYRRGGLSCSLRDIVAILGNPNVQDDEDKVTHSWGFAIDGDLCGIWDYKGERWSTYYETPAAGRKLRKLFPPNDDE
jgi:hypothetical protein